MKRRLLVALAVLSFPLGLIANALLLSGRPLFRHGMIFLPVQAVHAGLDGRGVVITGDAFAPFDGLPNTLREFTLTNKDFFFRSYNPEPPVGVRVVMKPGVVATIPSGKVRVTGRFSVGPWADGKDSGFEYRIDADRVESIPATGQPVEIADYVPGMLGGFFSLLCMARLASHRNKRLNRLRSFGSCPICGYDMRATPERCPECGTIPSKG